MILFNIKQNVINQIFESLTSKPQLAFMYVHLRRSGPLSWGNIESFKILQRQDFVENDQKRRQSLSQVNSP